MAESRAQAYAQQLDALTRAAEALTPEARRRILALLADANREIMADLTRSDPSSYNAARLNSLKAQVDRIMAQFAQQASSEVERLEEKCYREAAASVNATVAAATSTLVVQPVINRHALQVVQGYTADLVTGLSRDASAKINAAIQRAYLGGADLRQLTAQIGHAISGGQFTGIFDQVGERALTISTNEIMRIHSVASQAQINALAEHHPKLGKGWRHIPVARVPRVSHLLANGQVVRPDLPFIVAGEQLMYPRDPSGSAENTINCHCLLYPAVSNEDLQSTDKERELLASYGISVVKAAA